jgi:hypothetical protein
MRASGEESQAVFMTNQRATSATATLRRLERRVTAVMIVSGLVGLVWTGSMIYTVANWVVG